MIKLIQIKHRNKTALTKLKELAAPLLEEYYLLLAPEENIIKIIYFLDEEITANEIKKGIYNYYFISLWGENIGFVEIHKYKDGSLHISQIFLEKDFRGQGYFKEIFELIKQEALKQEINQLRTSIPDDKPEIIELFKKYGFEESDAIARYYGDGLYIYEHIFYSSIA